MQTDQQTNRNEGVIGAVSSVAEKLPPLCLAAVLLAGLYGYLTHVNQKEERDDFQERQLKLISMMDGCYEPAPPNNRRNE